MVIDNLGKMLDKLGRPTVTGRKHSSQSDRSPGGSEKRWGPNPSSAAAPASLRVLTDGSPPCAFTVVGGRLPITGWS